VQGWRDAVMAETKAPKTVNRRISSLSSFYRYLAGSAAELLLPSAVVQRGKRLLGGKTAPWAG